jgi:hypothetical protein
MKIRAAAGIALLFLICLKLPLLSQTAGNSQGSKAVLMFSLDFPSSDPDHYSISVHADGHSSYDCTAKISQESTDEDAYHSEFEMSSKGLSHIFDLTQKAQYFAGKIDSGNRKLAFTGTKILTYEDGTRKSSATYNYSSLAPVQELTAFFQSLAATLDYGRRLAYSHRYQKLALDDELKRMEVQVKSNELNEIQAVAPVLQEILNDSSVINVVRARAQEIMAMGKAAARTGR